MIKHIQGLDPLFILGILAIITTLVGLYVLAHVVKSLKIPVSSLSSTKMSVFINKDK